MQAFVAYSIQQSDAHMVYELGDLLGNQGYSVVYDYTQPGKSKGQNVYDEIAVSGMFLGLLTAARDVNSVLQLWQYARNQGIPAMILCEDKVNLPGNFARDPNIIVFRRFMPENPIKYIELWISHHF